MLLSILPRHALYLDPGSGSILFQVLIAGLLAAGVFVRTQWSRIKGLFSRSSKQETTETEHDTFPDA